MDDQRNEEFKFFGFSLDQTSTIILFYLVIIFLINSISTIYEYILDFIDMLPLPPIKELVITLIGTILFLIQLLIMIYTLFSCLKTRDQSLIDQNDVIDWFGFSMNRTSATVLLFLSLFGLMIFFIGIYGAINIIIFSWNRYLDLSVILTFYIPIILVLIEPTIYTLICGFTIYKCFLLSKRTKTEMEPPINENINNTKFFRFELNNTSASIIFIRIIIGIISISIIILVYIFDFTLNINPSDIFSHLLFFIIPLIVLGFYIYPLFCCLRFRKTHLNNTTEGVKWFDFEMNITSACVLYLISILGIISFLNAISEFVSDFFDILRYNGYSILIYPIGNLITEIIFMLIYIYTFRKCLKVRKLLT